MELQEKLTNFDYYNESHFKWNTQSLRVFPEAPFYWKLLIIGKVNVKRIGKNVPALQAGWPSPVPPMPPIMGSFAPFFMGLLSLTLNTMCRSKKSVTERYCSSPCLLHHMLGSKKLGSIIFHQQMPLLGKNVNSRFG